MQLDTLRKSDTQSEERYRLMLEHSPVMIYEFLVTREMEFYFCYVNPACETLLAMPAAELLAHPERLFELMLRSSQMRFFSAVKEAVSKRTNFVFEDWLFFPNGAQKFVQWTAKPRQLADGGTLFSGAAIDSTERKKLEESLAANRQQLHNIVSNVVGMVYLGQNDKSRAMEFVNEGCMKLTGYSAEEFMSNKVSLGEEVIHPDDRDRVWYEIQQAVELREPFQVEYRLVTKLGETKWALEYGRALFDENDLPMVLVGFITDISERKRLEAELAAKLKEIQETQAHLIQSEKMSSLGQMVAGIAHELNTPIGYVSNNVEIAQRRFKELARLYASALQALEALNRGEIEQAVKEFQAISDSNLSTPEALQEIVVRTERLFSGMTTGLEQMAALVKGMRNFARLDEAEMKKADLNEGIKSCLLIIGHQFKEQNIRLTTEYGNIPMVDCYPAQLNQVFLNLIQNAVHAVEQSPKPHIHISTSFQDGYVVVKVQDNGTGIPRAIQAKIFDPFFTTKPVGKGTGLGLSICYSIVKKHNGELYFETEEGKGTSFFVKIPAVDFLPPTKF
ncbi:MAG: ATP-binding protein [Chloroherpetonaceae bacterium]|nr:ATP-binding protein [Chloroherpetonaceae bacterium]